MGNTLLSVKNLQKSFGTGDSRIQVLKNVNLTIQKGEFVSIMGPSGCGKSTLLNLLGGLDVPDSGSVLFGGKNLFQMTEKERSRIRCGEIGFIFQFYNLIENLTVEENILLPSVMAGKRPADCRKKTEQLLDSLSLTEKRKSYPTELSGGQQQRTAIARALLSQPKIILADEPTGNLDSATGEQVIQLFRQIHREYGVAIVLVTHSDYVASFANRQIRISDGQIVSDIKK